MSESQLKILLVDDDEVDRLTVKRALKKAGLTASLTEAKNGAEALNCLKANIGQLFLTGLNTPANRQNKHFNLILLDYRLPDIDGLSLIEEIKKHNIDIPIIVLTGQGDEAIAVEIMKAGASDYLSKGKIGAENLAKAINNAIRLYQAEQTAKLADRRLRASNELLVLKNQELEKQQRQIKLQNIQLQQAYNLKSEFLATMSHELRTPMNAIMGFSQLLLRQYPDPLSPQQKNLVERIFHNSQNLLTMINEMLDFSKIEAGKLELNAEKFDLTHLVSLTVEELRSLALQKHIGLVSQLDLKNPHIVQDSGYLKRALINLLSNALKFTDTGEVKVRVWEIDSEIVAIAVEDTGIGIAAEDLDKIFQAFRQVDQSFTRKHPGTGLGLAITQSLVRMMGGTISVTSQLGEGSTFKIEIPRKSDLNSRAIA